MNSIYSLSIILLLSACHPKNAALFLYNSSLLKIEQITPNAFQHISFLEIPNYGPFPCNGLVYVNNGEAIIFDTPTNTEASLELIHWVQNELHAKIKAVVINHFHVDCLAGLEVFHQAGIPSRAHQKTIELAIKDRVAVIPQYGFHQTETLQIGKSTIENRFFGEGHTKDNIVSYILEENLLFGGCMIKELGAGKGNLADANLTEWGNTVKRIKATYPNLQYVVPGHGKIGNTALLDYTIELFKTNQ